MLVMKGNCVASDVRTVRVRVFPVIESETGTGCPAASVAQGAPVPPTMVPSGAMKSKPPSGAHHGLHACGPAGPPDQYRREK